MRIRLCLPSTAWVLMLSFLLAPAPAVRADEVDPAGVSVTVGEKGLAVQSKDGRFEFELSGRVQADATLHVGDTPANTPSTPGMSGVNRDPTDGTEIRRARLAAQATVYRDWHWMGEVDFANNEAAVKDFFLAYTGLERWKLSVGHQKQPYSLALEMSSNDLPFTERSIDNALVVAVLDRAVGVRAETHGERWYVAGGFYGESVEPSSENADEGWGAAAKAVVTPILEDDRLVHLGFRGAMRRPETGNESIRFRDETTNMSDYRIVDTGALEDVQNIFLFGPEAAFVWGPVSIFGEYNRAILQRNGFSTVELEGGHVGATWALTGESWAKSYTIRTGEFKRLRPRRDFSLGGGGAGAWELAARFAHVNLNDGGPASSPDAVLGGKEQRISASLNWYPNYNIRMMLGYEHVLQADVATASPRSVSTKEGEGLDIFTLRAQLAF
ncbi:MAG: OprO/OprP family phosphate-selective porin [bacterium]